MKIVVLTYAKDHLEVPAISRLTGVARARGHTVLRVRYQDCSMSVEDGVAKMYHKGASLNDIDAVIPWIIQGDFEYGMSVLRHFECMGVTVLNSAQAFGSACNKWLSAQCFALHNIRTPDTHRLIDQRAINSHLTRLPSEEAVIKITHGTKGNGVIFAHDAEMAESVASTLSIARGEYIIQQYIHESRGVDIRAYVVDGDVIAAMRRQSNGGFRANLHQGGSGTIVSLTDEEQQLAVAAVRALGLNTGGVDLMHGANGVPCVVEVNASGGFGIEKVTGRDVATPIIEYIEQNARRGHKKDKVGA